MDYLLEDSAKKHELNLVQNSCKHLESKLKPLESHERRIKALESYEGRIQAIETSICNYDEERMQALEANVCNHDEGRI